MLKQLLIFTLFCLLSIPSFSQETWMVDNAHSNVRFEVGWEDFSIRTGEFKSFDGHIIIDSLSNLTNASILFNVDAASIDVISDRLFDRVISDKFLNVEEHPQITFTSDQVSAASDSTYTSNGKLTICGVEKEQDVSIWVKGYKETKKGDIFGIEVTLVVDRSEFGLTWGSPRLGDKVKIVGYLLYKEKKGRGK